MKPEIFNELIERCINKLNDNKEVKSWLGFNKSSSPSPMSDIYREALNFFKSIKLSSEEKVPNIEELIKTILPLLKQCLAFPKEDHSYSFLKIIMGFIKGLFLSLQDASEKNSIFQILLAFRADCLNDRIIFEPRGERHSSEWQLLNTFYNHLSKDLYESLQRELKKEIKGVWTDDLQQKLEQFHDVACLRVRLKLDGPDFLAVHLQILQKFLPDIESLWNSKGYADKLRDLMTKLKTLIVEINPQARFPIPLSRIDSIKITENKDLQSKQLLLKKKIYSYLDSHIVIPGVISIIFYYCFPEMKSEKFQSEIRGQGKGLLQALFIKNKEELPVQSFDDSKRCPLSVSQSSEIKTGDGRMVGLLNLINADISPIETLRTCLASIPDSQRLPVVTELHSEAKKALAKAKQSELAGSFFNNNPEMRQKSMQSKEAVCTVLDSMISLLPK